MSSALILFGGGSPALQVGKMVIMPRIQTEVTSFSPLALRAVAAEAAILAGGVVAGALGTLSTRDAMGEGPHPEALLWPPGLANVGREVAYMAIGALPMGVPFAAAAALVPPSLVAKHPLYTWGTTHLFLVGAYPASMAIGFAGLEHRAPPHAVLVAALVGTVIEAGIEIGIVCAACAALLVCVSWNATSAFLPARARQWANEVREEGRRASRPVPPAGGRELIALEARMQPAKEPKSVALLNRIVKRRHTFS